MRSGRDVRDEDKQHLAAIRRKARCAGARDDVFGNEVRDPLAEIEGKKRNREALRKIIDLLAALQASVEASVVGMSRLVYCPNCGVRSSVGLSPND